jgi:hypothetical protein
MAPPTAIFAMLFNRPALQRQMGAARIMSTGTTSEIQRPADFRISDLKISCRTSYSG